MFTFQDLYESYATNVYRLAFWLAGDGSDYSPLVNRHQPRYSLYNIHAAVCRRFMGQSDRCGKYAHDHTAGPSSR